MIFPPGRSTLSGSLARVGGGLVVRGCARSTPVSSLHLPPRPRPFSCSPTLADIQAFLSLYPRFKPDRTKTANVDFYSGNGRAKPDDATIDELLTRLEHDWDEVESNQWVHKTSSRPGHSTRAV